MGAMKDLFMKDAELAFRNAGMFGLNQLMNGSELEDTVETIHFDKGNFKTTLTVRFNKDGRPIMHSCESDYVPFNNQQKKSDLESLISEAVKQRDFRGALALQSQLDKIE